MANRVLIHQQNGFLLSKFSKYSLESLNSLK